MKFLYLLVNFFTILVPFIFSFHKKLRFDKLFLTYLKSSSLIAIPFILWDIFFTQQGIWGFNPHYVSGIYVVNLPIEEVLFFFCIPFSCLFTYHCLNLFYQYNWQPKTENYFVFSLALILFIVGILFLDKRYTSYTFISLSVLLLFLKFKLNITWLAKLLSIYPILLIPFFIVNGILTGTGLQAPVVWYNDAENLGIRIGTIPIEDIFYGFELILLNVFFLEKLKPLTKLN